MDCNGSFMPLEDQREPRQSRALWGTSNRKKSHFYDSTNYNLEVFSKRNQVRKKGKCYLCCHPRPLTSVPAYTTTRRPPIQPIYTWQPTSTPRPPTTTSRKPISWTPYPVSWRPTFRPHPTQNPYFPAQTWKPLYATKPSKKPSVIDAVVRKKKKRVTDKQLSKYLEAFPASQLFLKYKKYPPKDYIIIQNTSTDKTPNPDRERAKRPP